MDAVMLRPKCLAPMLRLKWWVNNNTFLIQSLVELQQLPGTCDSPCAGNLLQIEQLQVVLRRVQGPDATYADSVEVTAMPDQVDTP